MNEELTYSKVGLQMTERFESCILTSNWDAVGGCWQIGWCHTGPEVGVNQTITQDQADALLLHDTEVAQSAIYNFVTIQLTQNEFDALVDFIYNIGSGNFRTSTLLKLLNAGNLEAAANEFVRWDQAQGKVIAGLLRRRQVEQTLFNQPGLSNVSSNQTQTSLAQSQASELLQKSSDLVQRIDAALSSLPSSDAGSTAGAGAVATGEAVSDAGTSGNGG